MIVECHRNLSLSKLKLNTLKLSLMSWANSIVRFLFIQWTVVSTCANDFITARKRSCGKVMFFRPVCQSFCSRGLLGISSSRSRGGYGSGGVPLGPRCIHPLVTHPGQHPLVTSPRHTLPWTHPTTHIQDTHIPGHPRTHTPQKAGGMHPTGMFSYLVCYSTVKFVNSFVFYCPNCDFCCVNLTNED